MRSGATLLVMVAVCLGLPSCKKSQTEGGAEEGGAEESGATEDQQLGAELNPYIECINAVSPNVYRSRNRYLSWVDAETGPTGKERTVYGLYEIRDPKRCLEGMDKVAATAKVPGLADAGKAYASAITDLRKLVADAHKYYDQQDYKDDDFAGGKEQHKKLMAAFAAFQKADAKVKELVTEKSDDLQLRELERLKREGKTGPYVTQKMVLAAKAVVEAGDVPTVEDFDLDKFTAKLKELEAAVSEVKKFAEDENKAIEAKTGLKTRMDFLLRSADSYIKVAKQLMRRMRDQEKGNETSPKDLIDAYNDVIDNSNAINDWW